MPAVFASNPRLGDDLFHEKKLLHLVPYSWEDYAFPKLGVLFSGESESISFGLSVRAEGYELRSRTSLERTGLNGRFRTLRTAARQRPTCNGPKPGLDF